MFPYYLSLGMTYEQFWEMDSSLAKAYRKADRMRRQQANYDLWLQGRYIYDALCCAAPIFRSLAKPGTTAHPYLEKPYDIYPDKSGNENERKKRQGLTAMKNIAAKFNQSRRAKAEKERAAQQQGMVADPDQTPSGSE